MEGLDEWLPPLRRYRNRLTDRAGIYEQNCQRMALPHTVAKIEGCMAILKELLDVLVCPVCKSKVDLKEDKSGLKCRECKRVYPIRDDLPIMLKDQAAFEA
jgi:uncharacterized protein YbaR (Trm112 family)